jgi:hypothetical protein
MCRYCKIFILILVLFCCEHKEFSNPYDPINLPPPPYLLNPGNDSLCTQNPPTFQWELIEDTLNPMYGESLIYHIQIAVDANFNSIIDACSLSPSAYYILYDNYFGDKTYYWRVRAKYVDGGWGEWSDTYGFTVRFPVISTLPDISNSGDMTVNQNNAFLAQTNELTIIDISNPYAPALLNTFVDTTTYFSYLFASGGYLYTTNSNYTDGSFSVYDLTNPAHPQLMDRYALPTVCPAKLWIAENRAYVCSMNNNIFIFDISNPESVYVETELHTYGYDIRVHQNYAYVLTGWTCQVWDLTNYSMITAISIDGNPQTMCISNNYLYIGGSKIWIYDISTPHSISLINTIYNNSYTLCARNHYLFSISNPYDYSLYLYSVEDVLQPQQLGEVRWVRYQLGIHQHFIYVENPSFFIVRYE